MECYDKAFHKSALEAALHVKHPHLMGQSLNKTQVIGKLIDASFGFPTVQEWVRYMEKATDLHQRGHPTVTGSGGGSDDEDKEESKAQRHTRANSTARTRKWSRNGEA